MKKINWLALCALLGAAVLTGCGAGESEPFEEKTYTAQTEQVREVRLDVRDRSIEVSASEDGQIHIGCAEKTAFPRAAAGGRTTGNFCRKNGGEIRKRD